MITIALSIFLFLDMITNVVILTRAEKVNKENKELKERIEELENINFELFNALISEGVLL